MKKIKLKGKLSLNKQSISILNEKAMNNAVGGKKTLKTGSSVPCAIDDDSRPVLCSPDLPKTLGITGG